MVNTISLPEATRHLVEPIAMSNGLTSVFLEVLTVSGSMGAAADREKELVIWLSQRDQSVVGIGTVSFDLSEMPWTVVHSLNRFRLMIEAFGLSDVDPNSYTEWVNDDEGGSMIPTGYPKCEKHDVYLNCHGCLLCNNDE